MPPISDVPSATLSTAPDWVPNDLKSAFEQLLGELPLFPSRKCFAAKFTDKVAELSDRTREVWPIATRLINGRACPDRREALEFAFRQIVDSPAVRGGRRFSSRQEAA